VLPKPLVPIDEKPVIEHIIDRFQKHNIADFWMTVNHKSRIIKAYFEEMQPDYNMSFIDESVPLGTVGSLKFLEGKFDRSFFFTNCDTIINADYADLYEFHCSKNFDVTLVASMKQFVIPFGTCELENDGHLSHINEKPEFNFLVNTGLYVLNPSIIELIPVNQFYHITELIACVKANGRKVGVYPISEDAWIDVGQWTEYRKAVEKL
jgi:NDP-sugar pyrophosphorylase family protein